MKHTLIAVGIWLFSIGLVMLVQTPRHGLSPAAAIMMMIGVGLACFAWSLGTDSQVAESKDINRARFLTHCLPVWGFLLSLATAFIGALVIGIYPAVTGNDVELFKMAWLTSVSGGVIVTFAVRVYSWMATWLGGFLSPSSKRW